MPLKRFPDNYFINSESSNFQNPNSPALSEYKPRPVLDKIAPPINKQRKIIPFLLLAICFSLGYFAWNSFIRYDAHGVVEANIIGIYSPTEGVISNLFVKPGEEIKKGQKIVEIYNSDDDRNIKKLEDEIKATQSEIESLQSQLRWKRGSNQEIFHKAVSELAIEEGNLEDLKTRTNLLREQASRMRILKEQGAISSLEADKAETDYKSNQILIASKINIIAAMKNRIDKSRAVVDENGNSQIKPITQRLEFLKNEIARLNQKREEGNISSPVDGTVSSINSYAGERINRNSDAIVKVVEKNTAKFVLYFKPDQFLPKIKDQIKIWSPTINDYVKAEVTGYSKDSTAAPDQIKRFYSQDEKLLRVFLSPTGVDVNNFIVGEIIRKPMEFGTLFNLLSKIDARAESNNQDEQLKH